MAFKLLRRPLVLFVTSTGCESCKPAFFLLQRIKNQNDIFDIKVINIRERKYSDTFGHYCHDLPVIILGDNIISKSKVTEEVLREQLRALLDNEFTS